MQKGQFSEPLLEYCIAKGVREHPQLQLLRSKSELLTNKQMLITPEQGAFIAMLVRLMNAQNYLEIGVFTGYSTLWAALALPKNGKITALEINDAHLNLAKKHWQNAGVSDMIEPIIAPAQDSLSKLINDGRLYDIAFIDANKSDYINYYEACLKLVRQGGLIIIDNVLMYGLVLEEKATGKNYVQAIKQLNNHIKDDPRVEICMLPVGDGMTLAQRI